MTDFSHLNALQHSLYREMARLEEAKTEREKAFRVRCIASKRKEIAFEKEHLKSIESDAFAEIEMAYLVEALALGEALYRVLHFLEQGAGDKDAIVEDIRKTLDIGNAGR